MKLFYYARLQTKLLVILTLACILPMILFYLFIPYEVKYSYLIFFVILVFIRFGPYKDEIYITSLKKVTRENLHKELKKSPSHNQVSRRIEDYKKTRDYVFIVFSFFIFLITALFGKL